MLTVDEVEKMLRNWGWFFGVRPARDDGDDYICPTLGSGQHPIATAMEFAGGTDRPAGRSARAMAKVRGTPTWGFAPAVCTETRSHRTSTPDDVPVTAQRVQRASLELQSIDPLRGLCLRTNYCTLGSHFEKAAAVSATLGELVTLRTYRHELALARVWMHARLTA